MRIVKSSKAVEATKTAEVADKTASVTAAKDLSANEQALTHIKAAIDILGKSGQKDAVTKDTIANLGVVMFDLKSTK